MTRGRTPSIPAAPVLDGEVIARANPIIQAEITAQDDATTALIARDAGAAALARQLHYDGPLDPDVLEQGVADGLNRAQSEVFNAGQRLLLLKQQCAPGDFHARLERIGIGDRAARKVMAIALRFSNRPTLAGLNKCKLIELSVLDDDEIAQLAEDGSVGEITLDSIDRMSVRELRAKLRESDERIKAKDKVAEQTSAAIQELREQLAGRPRQTLAEGIAEAMQKLSAEALLCVGQVLALRGRAAEVFELTGDRDPVARLAVAGAIGQAQAALRTLADDLGLSPSEIDREDYDVRSAWAATNRELAARQGDDDGAVEA